MGKGPRAAICAIGCVEIHDGAIFREFYTRVDLEDAMRQGGEVDASTLQWWLKQSAAASGEVNGTQEAESLWNALGALRVFMGGIAHEQEILVWGNGATFDNVILGNAYAAYGEARPWAFWNDRDLRTLLALYPEAKALPFEGTKHHALHDARHEARQLIRALELHAAARADTQRLDWLADLDNCSGNVQLPTQHVLDNAHSLRAAIDATMEEDRADNREPYKRQGDDMDLPAEKTCADCVHCRRCTLMFGHIPADEVCDWSPSRFREAMAAQGGDQ